MAQSGSYDRYREDVAGRANVADTDELVAFYRQLEDLDAGALWTVANKIEPWEPASQSAAVLWPYEALRPYVLRALDLVTTDQAGRRVVYYNNPGRSDVAAAVGADFIVKGLRTAADYDIEQQMAHMNHSVTGIRTVFLPCRPDFGFVSSRFIREIAAHGAHQPRIGALSHLTAHVGQ